MAHAYGSDRVVEQPDGQVEIRSPLDKGWQGRRDRTRTMAMFPGTPVLWDDGWYEVRSVRRQSDGTYVYLMSAWPDDVPMRTPSHYDDESEADRWERHSRTAQRASTSRGIALAGLVIGHIPGHAQREIEREYGFSATALSLVSLVMPFLFVVWVAAHLPIRGLPPPHASPAAVLAAVALFVECVLRFIIIFKFSSPCGSVAGLVAYEVWRMTTKRGAAFESRAAVKAEKRLRVRSEREADAATAEKDAYELRLPFLALLSPLEQTKLQATFGFDPRSWGARTALVIGAFTLMGVWSSFSKIVQGAGTFWTWSSLFAATLLAFEQIRRLIIVYSGRPAGSVLGGLVRPFCRKLLIVQPKALKTGSVEAVPLELPDVWEGNEPDDQTGR